MKDPLKHISWLTTTLIAAAFPVLLQAQSTPSHTHGALRVVTDPPGAAVYIDGSNRGVSPLDVGAITPGDHLVEVRLESYNTWRTTTRVDVGQRAVVEVELSKTKALLLVKAEPEGALIKIDGIDQGRAPALITSLDTGSYRMNVNAPGYISKEIEVDLPDRRPRIVDVELVSDFGTLTVSSEPTGAAITLNGTARGMTPATIPNVPTGTSQIELNKAGYEPFSETVRLAAGETQPLIARLKPIPASLRIVSIPAKARIYVNDQFQGTSPVSLRDLQPGPYRIRAELLGHDPMARSITLGLAQSAVEEFRMVANVGTIKLTTEPAGVEVLIDGVTKGITKAKEDQTDNVSEILTLTGIPSGPHKLRLVHKDHFTAKKDVVVIRNDTLTTHVKLQRRFIPNLELRTKTMVYKGVYQGQDTNGDIRLEIRPGITKTFSRDELVSTRPIKQETPDEDL